jgi:hypothetical protein
VGEGAHEPALDDEDRQHRSDLVARGRCAGHAAHQQIGPPVGAEVHPRPEAAADPEIEPGVDRHAALVEAQREPGIESEEHPLASHRAASAWIAVRHRGSRREGEGEHDAGRPGSSHTRPIIEPCGDVPHLSGATPSAKSELPVEK